MSSSNGERCNLQYFAVAASTSDHSEQNGSGSHMRLEHITLPTSSEGQGLPDQSPTAPEFADPVLPNLKDEDAGEQEEITSSSRIPYARPREIPLLLKKYKDEMDEISMMAATDQPCAQQRAVKLVQSNMDELSRIQSDYKILYDNDRHRPEKAELRKLKEDFRDEQADTNELRAKYEKLIKKHHKLGISAQGDRDTLRDHVENEKRLKIHLEECRNEKEELTVKLANLGDSYQCLERECENDKSTILQREKQLQDVEMILGYLRDFMEHGLLDTEQLAWDFTQNTMRALGIVAADDDVEAFLHRSFANEAMNDLAPYVHQSLTLDNKSHSEATTLLQAPQNDLQELTPRANQQSFDVNDTNHGRTSAWLQDVGSQTSREDLRSVRSGQSISMMSLLGGVSDPGFTTSQQSQASQSERSFSGRAQEVDASTAISQDAVNTGTSELHDNFYVSEDATVRYITKQTLPTHVVDGISDFPNLRMNRAMREQSRSFVGHSSMSEVDRDSFETQIQVVPASRIPTEEFVRNLASPQVSPKFDVNSITRPKQSITPGKHSESKDLTEVAQTSTSPTSQPPLKSPPHIITKAQRRSNSSGSGSSRPSSSSSGFGSKRTSSSSQSDLSSPPQTPPRRPALPNSRVTPDRNRQGLGAVDHVSDQSRYSDDHEGENELNSGGELASISPTSTNADNITTSDNDKNCAPHPEPLTVLTNSDTTRSFSSSTITSSEDQPTPLHRTLSVAIEGFSKSNEIPISDRTLDRVLGRKATSASHIRSQQPDKPKTRSQIISGQFDQSDDTPNTALSSPRQARSIQPLSSEGKVWFLGIDTGVSDPQEPKESNSGLGQGESVSKPNGNSPKNSSDYLKELVIVRRPTLSQSAQVELDEWANRYLFADIATDIALSSELDAEVSGQSASSEDTHRTSSTSMASSEGQSPITEVVNIMPLRPIRCLYSRMRTRFICFMGRMNDLFSALSPASTIHWIDSIVSDYFYSLFDILSIATLMEALNICCIIAKRIALSIFPYLTDPMSWLLIHVITVIMLTCVCWFGTQLQHEWYRANTSNMRGQIMAWREDSWDSTVLRYLRWYLQLAIERQFSGGQHVILT